MRKILFRGKRVDNGEWVYGYLWSERTIGAFSPIGNVDEIVVDPATVGQYTGLTDKNGKKIWESDILKITDRYNHAVVWSVDYKPTAFCVNQKGVNFSTYFAEFPDGYYEIEVIGNTIDNPELLQN